MKIVKNTVVHLGPLNFQVDIPLDIQGGFFFKCIKEKARLERTKADNAPF